MADEPSPKRVIALRIPGDGCAARPAMRWSCRCGRHHALHLPGAAPGFVPLSPAYFTFLGGATLTYLVLVEGVKRRLLRRLVA